MRWKQPLPEGKGFFRKAWAVFWRFLCILCLIVAMGLTWYFGKNNTLVSGSHFHHSDFRDLGWSEAFDEMSVLLERDYAFGEWKRIDWDSLYEEYAGKVADAEKSGDEVAYYKAIREYALSLPEGHVSVQGNDYGLEKAHTEGGFGFAMVQLDDGRVVVSVMDEGCPAEEKGLKWGAEIIRLNELPVLTAIDQVPYKWVSPMSCSTLESFNLRKTLYLARAPLNRSVSVTFRNPDEIEERVITLTSYDDSAVALKETKLMGYPLPERYVEWSILPNE